MEYYTLNNIEKEGSLINLIYGERSNGKSYQLKHKRGIVKYLNDSVDYFYSYLEEKIIVKNIKKGSRFILMRRWKEEITTEKIDQYFKDVDVESLTEGKYNMIYYFRKRLYLAKYNLETDKIIKGDLIGYVVALSTEQNYAGASYLDVTDIIFEEFISRGSYLANEPAKLMNFYSTVDRKRGTTKMWLCGNTISKVFPYAKDWDIQDLVNNLKQGEIASKFISTGDYVNNIEIMVKISVEFCKSAGRSSFAIGSHKEMLNKGTWQFELQPLLPASKKDYKILYRFGFQYKNYKFLCEYLLDSNCDCVFFVYPYKKEFKNNIVVFSDIIKTSIYYQRDIYNSTFLKTNKTLYYLFQSFKENKIFYSSNECGTMFKQVIDFTIKK